MSDVEKRFSYIVNDVLIPQFCEGRPNDFKPTNFRAGANSLTEIDMRDFLRAWDGSLLEHVGRGLYRSSRSGAAEQFFWSGRKDTLPRTFSLWIEPIITFAVIARLHFDYGWPRNLVGSQSMGNWAFDVAAYESDVEPWIKIACEVKKADREIDVLLDLMARFSKKLDISGSELKGVERNAFKKVEALRKQKPPIFFAVGPNCRQKIFTVEYFDTSAFALHPASGDALLYNCRRI